MDHQRVKLANKLTISWKYLFMEISLWPCIQVVAYSAPDEKYLLYGWLTKPWPLINMLSLQWRHNGRDSVSNHQPHDCLLNGLFRRRSKKTWKLRVTGLCAVNSPGTGEFPAQMASNAENGSIRWRHHVGGMIIQVIAKQLFMRFHGYVL